MPTYSWNTGTSGVWATAGAWTPSGPPDSASADAVVAAAGTYTVTVGTAGSYTVDGLRIAAPGATVEVDGKLEFVGGRSLNVGVGTLVLADGGRIRGANLAPPGLGGTIDFVGGTLDGAIIRGTLDLSAANSLLTIANGVVLTDAAGTGRGTVVVGRYHGNVVTIPPVSYTSNLLVANTTTLDNATVLLSDGGLLLDFANGTGGTLTLGRNMILRDGGNARLSCWSQPGGTIINSGTIIADTRFGSFGITDTVVLNQGTITVSNGDTLFVLDQRLENSGLLTVASASVNLADGWSNTGQIAVTGGGSLTLGLDSATPWKTIGSISVTSSTVYLGGRFTMPQVRSLRLSDATALVSGRLDNSGQTLTLGAVAFGTLGLYTTGTISGGALLPGSGTAFSGGTLDNVAYLGTLDLTSRNAALSIAHGIRLTDRAGTGTGTAVIGRFASGIAGVLDVYGETTLDNAVITLSDGLLVHVQDSAAGDRLVLGAGLSLQDGGKAILSERSANGSGTANAGIVNRGHILAATSAGTFEIGGFRFSNEALITVSSGDNLIVTAPTFSNSGTLAIASASASLVAGWSNTGTISVRQGALTLGSDSITTWGSVGSISATGSVVTLRGKFTTAQLRSLALSNDAIRIAGRLVNAGATLALGAGPVGTLNLAGGEILGGVILNGGGAIFAGGTLTDVTYRGALDLSAAGSSLTVNDGVTFTGFGGGAGHAIIGSSSTRGYLFVTGGETLDNATLDVMAGGVARYDGNAGLTLGANLLLHAGSDVMITNGTANGDIVNRGRITADTRNGTLDIGSSIYPNQRQFTNQGTIAVSNGARSTIQSALQNIGLLTVAAATVEISAGWINSGRIAASNGATLSLGTYGRQDGNGLDAVTITSSTVSLNGRFTTGQLRTMVLSNDTVVVRSEIANVGATLDLGATSIGTLVVVAGGTISGGVIRSFGTALFSGTLQSVAVQGTLDLSAANAKAEIVDGIALTGSSGTGPGTVLIGGSNGTATMFVDNATTLDNAVINLVNGTLVHLARGGVDNLVLGRGLTVQGGAFGVLSENSNNGSGIVNNGRVIASSAGGIFAIDGDRFTNQGTIVVSNGDDLSLAAQFTNASGGTLSGGSYTVGGGSTFDIVSGASAPVATLAATLALAGIGSVFQVSPSPISHVAIDSSLSRVAIGGYLSLLSGRVFAAGRGVTVDGVLALRAGQYQSGNQLSVGATGTVTGAGAVSAPLHNAGTLVASGGTLTITGQVSGYGALAAQAGSVLQLNLTPIATLAGKVTLDGAGSAIRFGATDLQASLTAIGPNGSLIVLGNRGYAANGTLADRGFINMQGGTLSATALSVAVGAKLLGFGAVAPNLINNGFVEAYGGLLKLAGVQGKGLLRIDASSTLELAAAAMQRVAFASGGTGTLRLDFAASFAGQIGGLTLGDSIIFANETVGSASLDGGTLTVAGSAGTSRLAVSGELVEAHFAVQPDQHTIRLVADAARAASDLVPRAVPAPPWTPSTAAPPGHAVADTQSVIPQWLHH